VARFSREDKVGSTRREPDCWVKALPQPWTVAMEATIFSGWIYDYLLPHAAQIKVAHPLMLRAIAAPKKNDRVDAGKLAKELNVVNSHSFVIEPIDQRNDVLMCVHVYVFDAPLVTSPGQFAQSGVKQVRRDVANSPLGCDSR
jgi:hypothetical protein